MVEMSTLNLLKKTIAGKTSKGLEDLFKVKLPEIEARRREVRVDHAGPRSRLPTIFSSNAVRLFNLLPSEIKDPKLNIIKFKKRLKAHIMERNLLVHHY